MNIFFFLYNTIAIKILTKIKKKQQMNKFKCIKKTKRSEAKAKQFLIKAVFIELSKK